jgi:uncharacterized protein
MCKGQCPGTAIDADWRNRTEHCDMWKGLFRQLEEQLLDDDQIPLSASPDRRDIEAAFLEMWAEGSSTSIAGVRRSMAERGSADASVPDGFVHGDVPHGDAPHGDG